MIDFQVTEMESLYCVSFQEKHGYTIEQMAMKAVELLFNWHVIDGDRFEVIVLRLSDDMSWRFSVERRTTYHVKGLRGHDPAEFSTIPPKFNLDFARH
jgi:hypothetical protein